MDWMAIELELVWGVKILGVVKEINLRACNEGHDGGQSFVCVSRCCDAWFV